MPELRAGQTVERGGKKYLVIGKTFGSATKLSAGDVVSVEAEQANLERDPDGELLALTLWAPEVMGQAEGGADTLKAVVGRARKHGVLREKVRGPGGEIEYLPNESGDPATAAKARPSRSRCMNCKSPPVVDVQWADGRGRAWFCLPCFKKWIAEDQREIVRAWYIPGGEVPKEIGEGDSEQVRKLGEGIGQAEIRARIEKLVSKAKKASLFCPVCGSPLSPSDVGSQASQCDVCGAKFGGGISAATYALGEVSQPDKDYYCMNCGLMLEDVPEDGLCPECGAQLVEVGDLGVLAGHKAGTDDYPDESKKLRYVVQLHARGRSVHGDLRVEYKRGKEHYLRGWTVALQQPGAIKEPITTEAQLKKAAADPGLWKLDLKTGLVKPRRIRGGTVRRGDLRAFPKAAEIPSDWLNVEGVTDKPDPGEPVPVGATREYPGVFLIVARGEAAWGAQKPWFSEMFLDGNWKGRWTFRLIKREGKKFYAPETDEDVKAFDLEAMLREFWTALEAEGTKADVLPPGVEEEDAREGSFFVLMQPKEQRPYVLGKEAVEEDWLPPKGVSALPPKVRKSIPKELRYWEQDRKQALESRRRLAEEYEELGGPDMAEKQSTRKFVLTRRDWKGQEVIRAGSSTVVWDLWVDGWRLTLSGDPLKEDEVAGEPTSAGDKVRDVDGYSMPVADLERGESIDVKPDTKFNPTKETPCRLEVLDKGDAQELAVDRAHRKYEFKGKQLKGVWFFRAEDEEQPEGFWLMSRSEGPKTKEADMKEITVLIDEEEKARGRGQGVGGERQGDAGTDVCVCPLCGREYEHERGTPCNERECEVCGVSLVGKEEQAAGVQAERSVISTIAASLGQQVKDNIAVSDKAVYLLDDEGETVAEFPFDEGDSEAAVKELEGFLAELEGYEDEGEKAEGKWVTIRGKPVLIGGGRRKPSRTGAAPSVTQEAKEGYDALKADDTKVADGKTLHQLLREHGSPESVFSTREKGGIFEVYQTRNNMMGEKGSVYSRHGTADLAKKGKKKAVKERKAHLANYVEKYVPRSVHFTDRDQVAAAIVNLATESKSRKEEGEKIGRRIRGSKLEAIKDIKEKIVQAVEQLVKEVIGWGDYEDAGELDWLASEEGQKALEKAVRRGSAGFAFEGQDGQTWWFQFTTNAFQDREREIFSTKSLEEYVERHREKEVKGQFWYRHVPGSKFGDVRWEAVIGRFLGQAGPFDDTDVGASFKAFFLANPYGHPEIAPDGWGASHKYYFNRGDKQRGVYEWLEIAESSVLPAHVASNPWNAIITDDVKEVLMSEKMSEQEKNDLEVIGGRKLVEMVERLGLEQTKTLEGEVEFKALDVIKELKAVMKGVEDEGLKKRLGEVIAKLESYPKPKAKEEDEEEEKEGEKGGLASYLAGELQAIAKEVGGEAGKKILRVAEALDAYPYPKPSTGYGYPKPGAKAEGEAGGEGEKQAEPLTRNEVFEAMKSLVEMVRAEVAEAVKDATAEAVRPVAEALAGMQRSEAEKIAAAIEETPAASLEAMLKGLYGDVSAKVDGRSALAKKGPEEAPPGPGATGVPFVDAFISGADQRQGGSQ